MLATKVPMTFTAPTVAEASVSLAMPAWRKIAFEKKTTALIPESCCRKKRPAYGGREVTGSNRILFNRSDRAKQIKADETNHIRGILYISPPPASVSAPYCDPKSSALWNGNIFVISFSNTRAAASDARLR